MVSLNDNDKSANDFHPLVVRIMYFGVLFYIYNLIFNDMMVRIDDMAAPQAIVEGDNMTVYDSMGFDEHYYQIVDAW